MANFYNRDSVYWAVLSECFNIVQIFPNFEELNQFLYTNYT